MLLQDVVKIRVNPKNYKKLEKYNFSKIGDFIEISLSDLSNNSHVLVNCKCDICGIEKQIQYKSYVVNINKYNYYTCSSKCAMLKNEKTNLSKLGVKYPSQNKDIQDKYKITMLEKYGVDNSLKISGVNEKAVENSKSLKSKEKRKNTNIKKWGYDNITKSDYFFKNTKIGNDINFIKYLGNNNCLLKCGIHSFKISTTNYHNRLNEKVKICTICNPVGDSKSIKEKELFEFIFNNYKGEIIQSYRDGLEIDIYLPELNIGFEFNGLYWHSDEFKDKNYHLDKTNFFIKKGIRIIHIWEDDWKFKRDILESQIKNLIGISDIRIFARKCYIKKLKNVTNFLNDNHIQGVDRSCLKLGLFYNEELVSVMTFNKLEGRKMLTKSEYNLSRFCNKLGYSVVGSASRLLNHFEKNNDVTRIISYADKDWSVGKLYYILGFNNIMESIPDYKYIIGDVRRHKQNFKKNNLGTELTESKYMSDKGFNKVYDCGKIKFEKIN